MTVRAKFQCSSINKSPDNSSAVVNLMAVTTGSTENESWSKYTPQRPNADGHLQPCSIRTV